MPAADSAHSAQRRVVVGLRARSAGEWQGRTRARSDGYFYTRMLALEVDTSFASPRVTRVLDAIIAERGRPQRLRMDNGSELTSRHFLSWGVNWKLELA